MPSKRVTNWLTLTRSNIAGQNRTRRSRIKATIINVNRGVMGGRAWSLRTVIYRPRGRAGHRVNGCISGTLNFHGQLDVHNQVLAITNFLRNAQ